MEEQTISIKEMITYIYEKSRSNGYDISMDTIELILDLGEEFLDSKGLISIEEYDEY